MKRKDRAFIDCCKENNIPYFDEEINLKFQDLPHSNSKIEWWYVNTHFHEKESLKQYSLFFSFFRVKGESEDNYFIIYVLVDHESKTHQYWTILDDRLPKYYSETLKKKNTDNNALFAYLGKMMEEKAIYPDQSMPIQFEITQDNNFTVNFANSKFSKKDKLYCIEINNESLKLNFEFLMDTKTILHGKDGLTLADHSQMDQMFYYFIPHGMVKGHLNDKDVDGIGWYDHEFSINNKNSTENIRNKGWIWFSMQLEDGRQLSIYQVFNKGTAEVVESIVKVIDKAGNYKTFTNLSIKVIKTWQSNRTLNTYPVKWEIKLEEYDATLFIEALVDNQEIITVLTAFAFYEGVVKIRYQDKLNETKGLGFVEIFGNNEKIFSSKKRLMEQLSALILNDINNIYLPEHSPNLGMTLVRDEELQQIINSVPQNKIYEAGLTPLRDMLQRKGKAWRSFFCLVVINSVGGNSEKFRDLPVIGEILQSSSLIIDDIQDSSKMRRGKSTIHEIYGVDKAINSGLLGYFLFNRLMNTANLTSEQLLEVYKIYYDSAVSSVVGQCLDIAGMQDLLSEAVDKGDNKALLKAIIGTHNLKTGINLRSLAQIGVILGNGSKEQITKVGDYALNVGLAYQYMDDVRAYRGDERAMEEDIFSGKITLPVALAIPKLNEAQRRKLYDSLIHKNRNELEQLVVLLNELGVIDHCIQTAKNLVTDSWKAVEPVIQDSIYKAQLYYVGIYALEIHEIHKKV